MFPSLVQFDNNSANGFFENKIWVLFQMHLYHYHFPGCKHKSILPWPFKGPWSVFQTGGAPIGAGKLVALWRLGVKPLEKISRLHLGYAPFCELLKGMMLDLRIIQTYFEHVS